MAAFGQSHMIMRLLRKKQSLGHSIVNRLRISKMCVEEM
uniref:Uncharacterized protein n=1 Tax=Arundo donax TaxID=35708 RepID=A0A0A9B404_ARUDO